MKKYLLLKNNIRGKLFKIKSLISPEKYKKRNISGVLKGKIIINDGFENNLSKEIIESYYGE